MKVQIAMIDTEVHEHPLLENIKINNLWNSDYTHDCWHGTAVCGEICNNCRDVEIDVYPVFTENTIDPEEVLEALKTILLSEKRYHVINMSLGVIDSTWGKEFHDVCSKLKNQGSIIVAAFNNDGSMSYPACLSSVIGVDISREVSDGFIFIEGGPVNVLGPLIQRSVLYNCGRKLVTGSSFFCGYITGLICKFISSTKGIYQHKNVFDYLKLNAIESRIYNNINPTSCFGISKAIMFPFSKEIESILNLHQYIEFEIAGVYDFKFSQNYNRKVKTLNNKTFQVQSVNDINWEKFDTLILGHIDNYIKISLNKHIENLIKKCINYSKKIYSFDDEILRLYQDKYPQLEELVYYPEVNKNHFPHAQLGKMWTVPIPVIAVFGTRSQQGKFTTQIQLCNYLKKQGYRTGLITSEPSGGLFDADYIFPYGYNKTVLVPSEEYAIYINYMMYNSYLKGRDIILFGAQAAALPRHYFNMNQCTTMQFSLLFGLSPDIVILCVSPDDPIDLILRTIAAIEAFSQAVVQTILVNPAIIHIDSSGRIIKENLAIKNKKELNNFIVELSNRTKISIYEMSEANVGVVAEELLDALCSEE